MIIAGLYIATSLAVGLFLGGIAGSDELSRTLLERNAALENQIATQIHITNGLTAALIITACALACSLLLSMKRRHT